MMNRYFLAVSIAVAALQAQTGGASIAAEAKQSYNSVKNNIMKSAEKVPDAAYSFKPTPDLRSFAEVLSHVAESQMRTCSAVLGEAKSVDAAGKTTKTDMTAALEESFSECDRAYDAMTDANAMEAIKTPRGQRSRIGALAANTAHDSEQYGILSVYMRLKGIIPPSSDRSGK